MDGDSYNNIVKNYLHLICRIPRCCLTKDRDPKDHPVGSFFEFDFNLQIDPQMKQVVLPRGAK